jgi:hypothetical protein
MQEKCGQEETLPFPGNLDRAVIPTDLQRSQEPEFHLLALPAG